MNQWAASAEFHRSGWFTRERVQKEITDLQIVEPSQRWSPQKFAEEQIRGLVRQVFFSASESIRHVAFTASEPEIDVRGLCRMVGNALASEDAGSIAVAGNDLRPGGPWDSGSTELSDTTDPELMRLGASKLRANLWFVPWVTPDGSAVGELRSLMSAVRHEFDYSILQAPCVGASEVATAIAQLADGVVVLLSERRTRRASARHVIESMEAARVRVLGTVLCDRMFPIPEKIYRHL